MHTVYIIPTHADGRRLVACLIAKAGPTITAVPRVLLVRHATSVPPIAGGPDDYSRPLSDLGLRQADALVDALTAASPKRIVSSPYLRAIQTVVPTAEALKLPVETVDAVREWNSGIAPTPDWARHYRRAWAQSHRATSDGESHSDLERRAVAAIEDLAADAVLSGDVLVASHGTWIARALLGLGCSVDADFWLDMPMPAVFVIECDGKRLHPSSESVLR